MKHLLTLFAALSAITAVAADANSRILNSKSRSVLRPGRTESAAESEPAAPAAAPAAKASTAGSSFLEGTDIPLDTVFDVYGDLVKRSIIKDPETPDAKISFTPRKGEVLTNEDKIHAIEVLLKMNKIQLENYGDKFVLALPIDKLRSKGERIVPEDEELEDVEKVVSTMITFKNVPTDEAKTLLEGLKSQNAQLNVYERIGGILVTDTCRNILRMRELKAMIDVATPINEQVFHRQIQNASASDIKSALEEIVQESQKELEKQSKLVQAGRDNNVNRATQNTLLRRPGQQQNQPQQPANVESLVTSISSDADRGLIRGKVLIISDDRSNKLIIITSPANMKFFDEVIKSLDETVTPEMDVEVIRLKYAEAKDVADMINDLIGNASSNKSNSKGNTNQNAARGTSGNMTRGTTQNNNAARQTAAKQSNGESRAGELSKENVTVLADERINGLVVMARTVDMPTIHKIIESMDVKLSQVLIETVIIEVSLGDDLNTGVDWVNLNSSASTRPRTDSNGVAMYNYVNQDTGAVLQSIDRGSSFSTTETVGSGDSAVEKEYTWTKTGDALTTTARGVVDSVAAGGAYFLGGGSGGGASAVNAMSSVITNLTGSGINYIFKSKKLNLGAILHASKTDSHSKYLASPVVMTVDNKEAVINATRMRYLLKGFQTSGNSYSTMAVPDYEQKELGIEIKATPKINPNGTVMLKVEEKYSQVSGSQTIQYSSGSSSGSAGSLQDVAVPTTVTREMSADVLLENGETVIFSGLTETSTTESETGIPFLKDIPWIGKWLFSSVTESESRNELLVFMTPYVLDDSESASSEAERRKNALSDPRPWDDHGWSPSKLADPVAKKEVMRRLKEEAKKQNEERATRLAIEKWKLDRAKELEGLDKSEREFWIDAHRDELEKDERKEFDKDLESMSKEDLVKLATEQREKLLDKANEKIDANTENLQRENERGRLDAEREKTAVQ